MEPPTASSLLETCKLTPECSDETRLVRLTTLSDWNASHPDLLFRLLWAPPPSPANSGGGGGAVDAKSGCYPLHWAAGTGFEEAVKFIIEETSPHWDLGDPFTESGTSSTADVDGDAEGSLIALADRTNQRALHPSTGRTPLHYAARNGHIGVCRLLVERCGADSSPCCSRGGVSPLQLAVWQNRLGVVRYLIEANRGKCGRAKDVVLERNEFNCGLMHWVGLVPRHRWRGDSTGRDNSERERCIDVEESGKSSSQGHDGGDDNDGCGVLPLAAYLYSCGVPYHTTPSNCNSQGHAPHHKAAWGGNLPLLRYFRDVHGVYDDAPDNMGNYGADLARMKGHECVRRWLLEECSTDRRRSCEVLGLDVTATDVEIRKRYGELARVFHPDRIKYDRGEHKTECCNDNEAGTGRDFVAIQEAYDHLINHGGFGQQRNEKHYALKLLTRAGEDRKGSSDEHDGRDDDDLFTARILAIISDYGQKGFPVSNIVKRWNQIWADTPFRTPDHYVVDVRAICSSSKEERTYQKKVNLVKFLRWKCRGSGVQFRKVGGVMAAFDRTARKLVEETEAGSAPERKVLSQP